MLAGRVPVHTSALVMQAQPGAELACRAHNYDLSRGRDARPRGILSYYAAATLPAAQSVGDWLARVEAMVEEDVATGALPLFYRPDLHLLGNPDQLLPGM